MGPWVNRTPPIRGGIFRKYNLHNEPEIPDLLEPESSSDTDNESSVDLSSATTSTSLSECSSPALDSVDKLDTSIPSLFLDPSLGQGLRKRTASSAASSVSDAEETDSPAARRVEYTNRFVREGAEKSSRDYPSVDPEVQQGIIERYRALHQQIRDEGLYNCRYSEYGKEMLRYSALFLSFLFALHHGWYMTSAVFLGLFWVSCVFTYVVYRGAPSY